MVKLYVQNSSDRHRKKNLSTPISFDVLQRAVQWVVKETSFSKMRLHGNTIWLPSQLVILAVLWAWSDKHRLTDAFRYSKELSLRMFGVVAVTSYQGFLGALVRWQKILLPLVCQRLWQLMKKSGGEYWRIGIWLPLAVDGSRISTPRTAKNEKAFAALNYGKGQKAKSRRKWKNKRRRSKPLSHPVKPQIWLTLLWHMGLKMPWSWKTGHSASSERGHFLEMLKGLVFPENTPFCGDAGFISYELWNTILDQGHNLLIRVGGNVRLLRNLGHARYDKNYVYLWPTKVSQKNQPPLILRLITCQGPRGTIYLVTSVLSKKQLSDHQVKTLYKLRWGIELQFRAYKQTFSRRTLRSRTPENALAELDWSLVGLWVIQLFAVKEQIKVERPPEGCSIALAISAVQDAMQFFQHDIYNPQELRQRLRDALKDQYKRTSSKTARYRSKQKAPPTCMKPKIVEARPQEKKLYRTLFATT